MAKAKTKKSAKVAGPDVAVPGVGNTYPISARKWHFSENPSEFSFNYTTPGPHCEVKRLKQGRCATQLNFIDGKPVLRMCGEYGEPGRIVQVKDPEDAQRKAQKFCKTKLQNRPSPDDLLDVEDAVGLGETSEDAEVGTVYALAAAARGGSQAARAKGQKYPTYHFGEATPPRTAQATPDRESGVKPSTWWLMGGTIAGIVVATMLKKSAAAPKA